MFPRPDEREGFVRSTRIIIDLAWKPFDARYKVIRDNISLHSETFEKCVNSVLNEETLLHYDKMDADAAINIQHRKDQIDDAEQKAKSLKGMLPSGRTSMLAIQLTLEILWYLTSGRGLNPQIGQRPSTKPPRREQKILDCGSSRIHHTWPGKQY